MTSLILKLSNAVSCRDIDKVIEQNLLKLDDDDRNYLCQLANAAKIRISRKQQEVRESFKTYEKN